MEATEPIIDKSTWGDGPWQLEPDRIEWEHAGLPCLALRHPRNGNWCGYAAVAEGHPLYGKDYNDPDIEVHGGLTYAGSCHGRVCHVAKPGQPDHVWWFGFDCHHAWDVAPGFEARLRDIPDFPFPTRGPEDVYRTLDYVRHETERLAEQLAAMTSR